MPNIIRISPQQKNKVLHMIGALTDIYYIENMVMRKLLFWLVSVWLINTMVCFHGSNPFEKGRNAISFNSNRSYAPENLLLWLINKQNNVQQEDQKPPDKIKYRNRYIGSQYHRLQIIWKVVYRKNFGLITFLSPVHAAFRALGKSRTLVAACLLLFRLTPF
ncbi:hypothetical protein [Mucilaginibacter aquariorum]|uniref:Uncharacterized protein n=1 Tax=Mucilaginibacter aquariorum TaxID=2967225 RepID=A0ABT1T3I8_9SPHI|nr:hypothetical protein [Mucilaginibacter aquariorum]MCQ6959177.1 hypothetical protein [Mucilaginibacter aquariorum]